MKPCRPVIANMKVATTPSARGPSEKISKANPRRNCRASPALARHRCRADQAQIPALPVPAQARLGGIKRNPVLTFDPNHILVYDVERRIIRERLGGRVEVVRVTLPYVSILRLGPDAPSPRRLRQQARRFLTKPIRPIKQITRLLNEGHSQTQMARKVDVDPSYVHKVARRIGFKSPRCKA